MATTVRLFKKIELPAGGFPVHTDEQLKLFDEPAPTEFHVLGESEDDRYTKYRIRHANLFKMEGLVFGKQFDRCLRFETFPCFVSKYTDWVLSANVRGIVAAKAFRRLKASTKVKVDPVELDLLDAKDKLLSNSGVKIRGGWFSGLQIEKVEVAYIYGGAVSDSDDWDRYENSGKIGCLQLELPFEDSVMVVLLTRDASLTFLKNLKEKDYLDYATSIYACLFPPVAADE